MAEKYELDRWAAVVCNGFTAVNVMSSGNVEELGWDYTEMELDPTGTCGLFDGMLLDWDDDTPAERRDHEAYFPDAFTVGARILADDWDHELGNDEVRSRCFAIIEDADQFTDHDTARDWLCESTMADFSEVEARTFFQNLTLMDSEEIAKLDGRPIIPSAGADECRAAVLAFNERMVPRRRELGLGDTAVVGKTKNLPASQQATASGGMPRHRRDVRVGIPGGPRVRHRRRGRAHIGQHGRRTQRAPLLLRRRAETGPGVLQGTTFEDQAHRLPGNRRDLRRQPGRRAPPARIARDHQPGRSLRNARRRAPFLPWRRTEAGSGVLQADQARTRYEPYADGCRG